MRRSVGSLPIGEWRGWLTADVGAAGLTSDGEPQLAFECETNAQLPSGPVFVSDPELARAQAEAGRRTVVVNALSARPSLDAHATSSEAHAEALAQRIESLVEALIETTMRAEACDRGHAAWTLYAQGLVSISRACALTGMSRVEAETYLWDNFRELYPFNQEDASTGEAEGD